MAASRTGRRWRWFFKLVMAASKTWRHLDAYDKLPRFIEGVRFTDGIQADEAETRAAA